MKLLVVHVHNNVKLSVKHIVILLALILLVLMSVHLIALKDVKEIANLVVKVHVKHNVQMIAALLVG